VCRDVSSVHSRIAEKGLRLSVWVYFVVRFQNCILMVAKASIVVFRVDSAIRGRVVSI